MYKKQFVFLIVLRMSHKVLYIITNCGQNSGIHGPFCEIIKGLFTDRTVGILPEKSRNFEEKENGNGNQNSLFSDEGIGIDSGGNGGGWDSSRVSSLARATAVQVVPLIPVVVAGVTSRFLILSRDMYCTPMVEGGHVFHAEVICHHLSNEEFGDGADLEGVLTNREVAKSSPVHIDDNMDGTYSGDFKFSKAGF